MAEQQGNDQDLEESGGNGLLNDMLRNSLHDVEQKKVEKAKKAAQKEGDANSKAKEEEAGAEEEPQKPVKPKKEKAAPAPKKEEEKPKAPEEEEDETPQFLKDLLKDKSEAAEGEEEEEGAEQKPAQKPVKETPQSTEQETAVSRETQEKAEAYDKLANHPGVKALLKAEAEGKSFLDVVKEISSKNPDNYTEEQLLEMHFKGLDYTDEEIAEDMETLSRHDRKNYIKEQKNKLSTEYQEELKNLPPVKFESNSADQEKLQQNRVRLGTEIDELLTSNENKSYDKTLIKLTPERIKEVKKFLSEGGKLIKVNPDGTVDAKDVLKMTVLKLFGDDIVGIAANYGKNLAMSGEFGQVIGTKARTSNGNGNLPRKTVPDGKQNARDLGDQLAVDLRMPFNPQ
jgi:hypothetical protein